VGNQGFRRNAVVVLFCAVGPSTGAADLEPALGARLQAVEAAFRKGSASALRSCVSSGAKVRVELREVTEGSGNYGASQLQVIFERIFEENRTLQFHVPREQVTASAQGTAFARALWVRRVASGGEEVTDNLTLTLRREGDEWRIHEIRSSRS
jgi:hypothetical protein